MLKTVTATYASQSAVTNVIDELVNADVPRERIHNDGVGLQVKVLVPEIGVEGLKEILGRHHPTSVS